MSQLEATTWPWLNVHEPVPELSGFRPVISESGMVSSPHHLASSVGLQVLKDGGNAVDAAIATSAMLMVVCPMQCGPGGDALWLISEPETGILALDATGTAPSAASAKQLQSAGLQIIPSRSGFAVTVPGAVDGLAKAHKRFGTIPLTELMEPAALTADRGFRVSRHTRSSFFACEHELRAKDAARIYCMNDSMPELYEILRQTQLAQSLRDIGGSSGRSFYEGELAQNMADACQQWQGWLTIKDLANYVAEWVQPISTSFRGLNVYTTPPSSQGFSLLAALRAVESVAVAPLDVFEPSTIHLLIEAADAALELRDRFNADRSRVPEITELVNEMDSFAATFELHRRKIRSRATLQNRKGDTAHLSVVDRNGMGVSLIQSLFYDFGSCIPVPRGGFTLQNRGAAFSLQAGKVGELISGHHPPHTLMPTILMKEKKLRYVLGCMGGDGQMQTQLQLIVDLCDGRLDPQQAISRARWYLERSTPQQILVERDAMSRIRTIENRGHLIRALGPFEEIMGHAQIIEVTDEGVLIGGADPRSDGQVAGY